MKYFLLALVLFAGIIGNVAANENSFQHSYIPDGMDAEPMVLVDDYIYLLAKSSGYKYVPNDNKKKCAPIKIPLFLNKYSFVSAGNLKNVADYLSHISYELPREYKVEIHVDKKEVRLFCEKNMKKAK